MWAHDKKDDEVKKPKKRAEKPLRKCSFCIKTEKQVKELIQGPGETFICNECVQICHEIIEQARLKTLVYDTLVKLNKQMEAEQHSTRG